MNRQPSHRDQAQANVGEGYQSTVIKKIPSTWYVSLYLPDNPKNGRYVRRTKTFPSESAAKQFAAAKIAAGSEVSAGTLNPVQPKKVVGPSEMEKWLSEKPNEPRS